MVEHLVVIIAVPSDPREKRRVGYYSGSSDPKGKKEGGGKRMRMRMPKKREKN